MTNQIHVPKVVFHHPLESSGYVVQFKEHLFEYAQLHGSNESSLRLVCLNNQDLPYKLVRSSVERILAYPKHK